MEVRPQLAEEANSQVGTDSTWKKKRNIFNKISPKNGFVKAVSQYFFRSPGTSDPISGTNRNVTSVNLCSAKYLRAMTRST